MSRRPGRPGGAAKEGEEEEEEEKGRGEKYMRAVEPVVPAGRLRCTSA